MNKKVLIITSGGSQLITQLAALAQLNLTEPIVHLLYNGVKRDSLNVLFQQIADHLGFFYIGQTNFDITPKKISYFSQLSIALQLIANPVYLTVTRKFPQLDKFKNADFIFVPLRVKMLSDIVLLSYLSGKKTIYSVDGVVDVKPLRSFDDIKYRYLHKYSGNFPLNELVFSPKYLQKETEKIGIFTEVNTWEVSESIKNIRLAKKFRQLYLDKDISHIIFSQHLSLSENVSPEYEIQFYQNIFNDLSNSKSKGTILFKPHPRDTKEKMDEIINLTNSDILIIEQEFQSIPIELFSNELSNMETLYITANSSAVLGFEKNDRIILYCSKKYLTIKLNRKIIDFSQKYNLITREV